MVRSGAGLFSARLRCAGRGAARPRDRRAIVMALRVPALPMERVSADAQGLTVPERTAAGRYQGLPAI